MGQTLTHGVYLPDEGERNCYSGLAGNWQLLDGAVGTIAEHTSALAGKAPLVHTHTKSDITDFPAYGTTAGTICEGNDSRLSDARTPVAHTHTKSDVTDLLNSNFIPSANNAYDLGSSSYQWNNLYAKNYYYNGVAWGLDQANVWNTYQTIKGYYFGNEQSTNGRTCLYLTSNRDTVGQSGIYITKFRQNRAQGAMNPADLQFISFDVLENSIRTNGALQLNVTDWNEDGDVPSGAVLFSNLSNAQLGSPLAPWKTLNGVNPGALSLPDYSKAESLDVSAQGLNWDLTGATSNSYTPTFDGYLSLRCKDTNGDFLFAAYGGSNAIIRNCAVGTGILPGNAGLCLLIPMLANTSISIQAKATANFRAYIIPCFGNV